MLHYGVVAGRVKSNQVSGPWFVAFAALLAVVAAFVIVRDGRSTGGDPDGRILAALRPVLSAVPADATLISSNARGSTYEKKCPDNPGGRSGWSSVSTYAAFRSTASPVAVIESVGRNLANQGWEPVPVDWDHNAWQLEPLAEWAKPVPHGRTAHAVVYQHPEGSGEATGSWMLAANAKPPGFALAGC